MTESKTVVSLQSPSVRDGVENKGVLTFTIENCNLSLANAIRRVLLSDIETVVFNTDNNSINIVENTTRFHNEILKQRLGCIPLHIKDKEGIEDLIIELNMNNDSDSLQYVTSHDFAIKNITNDKYLTEQQVKSIFPPNKITKEYILFTRLRPKISNDIPGEKITLQSKLKVGTSKQDGMYNVVSTCAYKNTEDKVEQHNVWQDIAEKLETKGLNENKIAYQRQNWYTLEAKRITVPNSFDFKIETVGVFTNNELINMACENLIRRFNTIKEKCETQTLKLNKKTTAMDNCVDVILQGEDYTIGKVIEYVLHEQYYKQDSTLSYVGFIKKHPHDDYSIIRMAYNDVNNFIDTNIYSMIGLACDVSIQHFANIKEYF